MAKLEDIDPTLPPLVIAAMLDDEDEEDTSSEDKSSQATDEDNTENEDDQEENLDQPEEGNEVDESESTEKEDAELEETETAEDGTEKKLSRKEKREAKRARYLESIRKEGEQNSKRYREELFQSDPNYKPLDYNNASEVEVDDLVADRNKYGQQNFSKGASTANRLAEQDSFWQATGYEAQLLASNPKYAFLNENDPDNFDEERSEELNGLFLELVGYSQKTNTVQRTDISWKNFVEAEVERMDRWAARYEADTIQNMASQRATSGIRPSGSATKSLGKLKPGDITKMSAAEFAKNEAEIDRQILAELG